MSARRSIVSIAVAVLGVLVFAAQALAAPEVPEFTVESPVPAFVARLRGVLNPNAVVPVEAGSYEFLYRKGSAGCEGEGKVPVPPGMALGFERENVEEVLSVSPGTQYTACLRVENGKGEAAVSPAVTFTSALPPETPETLAASPVAGRSATLNGVLNPGGPGDAGTYEFFYQQSPDKCRGENRGEKVTPTTPALGHQREAVATEVAGLLPGTEYTVCVLARNEAGEFAFGRPVTFTTVPVPVVIEAESSSHVSATEARLEATINPGGSKTAYHFEYGPAAGSYDVSIPAGGGETAGGVVGVDVGAVAMGLTPGATYHYRVVAANALPGEVDGPDQQFTTPVVQGTGSPSGCPNEQLRVEQPYGFGLPDCRAYELVSPTDTNGQDATDSFADASTRAAMSGEAIMFESRGSFANPAGARVDNQFLSRRGAGGWSTRSITAPYEAYSTNSYTDYEAMAFTPELSKGVVQTVGPLTSEVPAGVYELYLADFSSESYRWFSTQPPGGEPYGEAESRVLPMGASTDLSRIAYADGGSLYEWIDGEVVAVGVANNGEPIHHEPGLPDNPGDPMSVQAGSGHAIGHDLWADTWRSVSSDGSRIFFTSPAETEGEGRLYVRENLGRPQSPMSGGACTDSSDACTIEVSASQRTNGPSPVEPKGRYWGASVDGSRVFFTSVGELTNDAYTGPAENAANLYEYDLESGKLIDLTVDTVDVAEGAAVQGVAQISEDGSYVYFVAMGDLAAGATAGQPNLYVSHAGGVRFVATLASADEADWNKSEYNCCKEGAGPVLNEAAITPDGTRLAFVSSRELTGYDNRDASTGEPDNEVYLYDVGTNALVCASCNTSGARPIGPSTLGTKRGHPDVEYRARNLSEGGALFFNSSDALVPHASDGRRNVYEYEQGHVYPISDVAGGSESFLLDVSADGGNVFFATADKLVAEDQGNRVAVYDARVGGGFPVSGSPPPCDNGDSCKPPPTPQPALFGAPGSATFSGAGNIASAVAAKPSVKSKTKPAKCKKRYAKKRRRCVKRRKPKGAKRSSVRKGSR